MRQLRRLLYLVLAVATLSISNVSFASNCIPDATSTFKVVTDVTNHDHLYWVDASIMHVCTFNFISGSLHDLTNELGLQLAGSPIVGVTDVPLNSNDVYLYFIDLNGHIVQIIEDSSVTDLFAQGRITLATPWTSVAAVFLPAINSISVTYGVSTGGTADKYGSTELVFRYDANPSAGTSQNNNIYSMVGRADEHLETQVNLVSDGDQHVFSTFDPEGEGHIQFISSNPNAVGGFQRIDLMDATGVGTMNVTTGGGIVPINNPTCQASGVAPVTSNGVNLMFVGTDGDLHHLSGSGTTFRKRDITMESGGTRPDGCGKISAVATGATVSLLYEAVLLGGRGLIQANLAPGGGPWTSAIVVAPSSVASCIGIDVLQNSPIAISSSTNGVSNHFYYIDTGGHVHRDCGVIFN